MVLHVLLQRLVDLVGHPQQCEFAQRREVSRTEVVRERGVDLLGLVDVAVGHAPPQGLRRHVDQLDLVGSAYDVVGQCLALLHSGDPLHDVVHRLEMLDVDRRDHVDARVDQLLDVFPALLVARTGNVRVGELIDEHLAGPARQDRVDIHLFELAAAILDAPARHDLELADLFRRVGAAVGLDEADDHIGATAVAAARFVQHGERLADARCGAQVDPEVAACHERLSTSIGPAQG